MTIKTNLRFSNNMKFVDDVLTFDYVEDARVGDYFSRNDYNQTAHTDGKVYSDNPKYNRLTKGTQNLYLLKGAVLQRFKLDDPQDMEVVSQFSSWAHEENPISYEIGMVDDFLEFRYRVDFNLTDWCNPPGLLTPDSDFAYVEVEEAGKAICILRVDGEPDAWTPQMIDIKEGNELTIPKEGNKCYVVFGGSVNKGDQELSALKMYKISSDSITVTANEDTRLIRIYRD